MKNILVLLISFFVSTLSYAQNKSVQAITAGGMTYAAYSAAQGATIGAKAKSCCSASPAGAGCCPLMVMAAGSVVSLLSNVSDTKGIKDGLECTQGSFLCGGANSGTDNGQGPGNFDLPDGTTVSAEDLGNGPGGSNSALPPSQQAAYANMINGLRSEAQAYLDLGEELGYELTPDKTGVKTPNGSVVSGSDFNSNASMSAAGYTDEDIAALNEIKRAGKNTSLEKALSKYSFGYAASGGSRNRGRARSNNGGNDMNKMFAHLLNKNKKGKQKRGVAASAGLSKSLSNGEKIGVANDNLFYMVHRRYQKKTAEKSFIP